MINSLEARRGIARTFGSALDDLVRDRMDGVVEEPDITSRIGQRLEERFDGRGLHGYHVLVITETISSHGSKSLEKPLSTDLYFAISIKDEYGAVKMKGILARRMASLFSLTRTAGRCVINERATENRTGKTANSSTISRPYIFSTAQTHSRRPPCKTMGGLVASDQLPGIAEAGH